MRFSVYDLRRVALHRYVKKTAMRRVLLLLGGLWVIMLAGVVVQQLRIPRPDEMQYVTLVVLYSGFSIGIGLSIWAAWMGRMGPVGLGIGEEGLAFHMPNTRIDLLPWDAMSKGVALIDYSESPLTRYTDCLWQIRRWNRPPADLTQDAFSAVLDAATRHGMRIDSERPRNSRWGPGIVVFRVRGRNSCSVARPALRLTDHQ